VRYQVLTVASMKFRIVFWDVLPCIQTDVDVSELLAASIIRAMMEAARTSETSVDICLTTRQYIPKDSELNNYLISLSIYVNSYQYYNLR
jgi:hypothetical protein